jgi:hypothetical protein
MLCRVRRLVRGGVGAAMCCLLDIFELLVKLLIVGSELLDLLALISNFLLLSANLMLMLFNGVLQLLPVQQKDSGNIKNEKKNYAKAENNAE